MSILFGALLRHHYIGGQKFKNLQKVAIFFAEIPIRLNVITKLEFFDINKPPVLKKHKDKDKFKQFITKNRNALLILPRYDHNQTRSVVEVIDLNNFEIIHTYKHDISEMNDKIKNVEEFPRINIDNHPIRFQYMHPLILNDGSLISDSDFSIEFKIDICSNLIWINDEEQFHHSKMLDHEGNIWVGGRMQPESKYIKKFEVEGFFDDSIIKLNQKGKILFEKSVAEILIENKILDRNQISQNIMRRNIDPIHLNDIEPALRNSKHWEIGDLFLSIRHQSAIIHYRPSNNKIINYIKGPFSQQHDVDIISDNEISIFNNNNFVIENEYSEVVVYNFETKKFRKLFNDQLKKENFKTDSQGLSHIFNDGALLVEEQNHGRIILFNNNGEKEWEYVNKDKNGDIGFISWSRIIEDKLFIKEYKSLVINKKCIN